MSSTGKLFVCERCDKTFRSLRDLDVHKARTKTHDYVKRNQHNEVVYKCDVCNHEFKYAANLVAHRKNFKHESKNLEDRNHPTVVVSTTLAFLKVHDAITAAFKENSRGIVTTLRESW